MKGMGGREFPFYFFDLNLKTKYLENRLSKFRTVFTFELLAPRSSKLDPMSIGFDELFFVHSKVKYLYIRFEHICNSDLNILVFTLSTYFVLRFLFICTPWEGSFILLFF